MSAVIPADISARYELTPGTQVEFVDEGGVIRLLVRRRVPVSDPVADFGLVKVKRTKTGSRRRLTVILEFERVMRGFYVTCLRE